MNEAKPIQVKPLKAGLAAGTPWLSSRSILEHHDVLYAGYVKKCGEISEKLATANKSEANATYSFFGELKREQVFFGNAVALHEDFFSCLLGNGEPSGKIKDLLERDFGSVDSWREDFSASAIAARGWVVLAIDLHGNRLRNCSLDIHTEGAWMCVPLVVLDVYEHAYFLDYGTARKKYVEAFMKQIDFSLANERLGALKIE